MNHALTPLYMVDAASTPCLACHKLHIILDIPLYAQDNVRIVVRTRYCAH